MFIENTEMMEDGTRKNSYVGKQLLWCDKKPYNFFFIKYTDKQDSKMIFLN